MLDFSLSGGIFIDGDCCIRHTFSKSHCRDCEDICPVDAIIFSPTPKINNDLCIECGLCFSACKFSAIQMDNDDWEIVKSTRNMVNVDIGCVKSNSEIKVACISRITEVLLVYWMLNGKNVVIKTGVCARCRFKDSLAYFKENVRKAIVIARSLGLKSYFKLKKDVSRETYIPKGTVSRREVFSGMFKVFRRRKSQTKRDLLLSLIKNREIVEDITYPEIGLVSIDDNCNLCGVCEYICPADAILIKKDEDLGRVWFYPSLCVGCMECEKACIRTALSFKRGSTRNFKDGIVSLFEAKKNVCKVCGKEFYASDVQDVCPICKNKEESKRKFLEFLKDI